MTGNRSQCRLEYFRLRRFTTRLQCLLEYRKPFGNAILDANIEKYLAWAEGSCEVVGRKSAKVFVPGNPA